MSDPRRFRNDEERRAFDDALALVASGMAPFIRFTVDDRKVMVVADELDAALTAILAAIAEGVTPFTYSEYERYINEVN